jgi:hypothetical protein
MVVLDIAIVNVALPSIQKDLGIGPSTLQWIVIAYGLMLGGFLLLGGRMADLLGRRRILLTGLVLFSSASLLAGLAGSAGFLIGARALQGFGAALLPPAALSILAVTFEEGADRNRALGIYGAVTGLSASVGVIASGLLTDGPGWRRVFLINVPVGVLLIATAGNFATDLLPALVLAGVAGELSAPAAQIGALSGVANSLTGLASGLVETMREIGGRHWGGRRLDGSRLARRRDPRCRRPGGSSPGYGERFPWRVLGDVRRRGPGRADGRDFLPAAHNPADRARAVAGRPFGGPATDRKVFVSLTQHPFGLPRWPGRPRQAPPAHRS